MREEGPKAPVGRRQLGIGSFLKPPPSEQELIRANGSWQAPAGSCGTPKNKHQVRCGIKAGFQKEVAGWLAAAGYGFEVLGLNNKK
eukprot:1160232-Pelagomonas_calceolata.AAC.8